MTTAELDARELDDYYPTFGLTSVDKDIEPPAETGKTRGQRNKSRGNGLCRGCLRNLMLYGMGENPFCESCRTALKHRPTLEGLWRRKGRPSERVPQEFDIADPSWRRLAQCRDVPIELFAPRPLDEANSPELRDVARVFCARCPVREECAAEADAHEYLGIWGGSFRRYTARDRHAREYRVHSLLDEV